ncbi:hypothetical protein Rhopal_004389-T1 [Rhodotorula paludigena]|uniref:Uncharacterized protein n=1 Tax=Rhodotorula paludigena TaxID=86838 RepID=A0AAV5GMD3_9BASI|nr:hypothetical protein Rhopal_004389-T1 [Rhodotorula paludigena]
MTGHTTHAVVQDDRNSSILIGMRDGVTGDFALVPREKAVVSVFDSAFLLGDGCWEGIRIKQGVMQFAKEHLDRLFETSKALFMNLHLNKPELLSLIHQTVDANSMQTSDDVHIRLVVSRGLKETPHQNPKSTVGAPLIVIIPEYKKPDPSCADTKDEMWNHLSKATDIQACIQANIMGADEALMLDKDGFVKTCNSTNFFIVRNGVVWAPTRKYQMQGITRAKTIELCRMHGIPIEECDFTLTEVYGADEAFVTGTFPSQLAVISVDGRTIGDGKPGPMAARLQKLYKELVAADVGRGREAVMAEVQGAKKVIFPANGCA